VIKRLEDGERGKGKKQKIRNPKLETKIPKFEIRNSKQKIRNSKYELLNKFKFSILFIPFFAIEVKKGHQLGKF